MGQYYLLVNLDKKEYVDPQEDGDLYKFLEIVWGGNTCKLLMFLLRKSDKVEGGGDIDDPAKYPLLGHWAGDRIELVGDYDSSMLFFEAKKKYKDITAELIKEYNEAMSKFGEQHML